MIQPEIPEVELVVKGYPELVGLLLLILQHHGLLLLPQRLQLFAQHLAHIKILPRVYKYTIFKPQRAILSASSLTHSALHILSTSKGPSLLQHNLANKRVEQIHIGYCFAHLCLLTADDNIVHVHVMILKTSFCFTLRKLWTVSGFLAILISWMQAA